jgi:outer membrane immunogenic protein
MKRVLLLSVGLLGLLASRGLAADYAPVQPEIPAFVWTGIYAGLAAGGGFADAEFRVKDEYCDIGCTVKHEPDGIVVGGQLGALYQMNQFVIGVEAQGLWADMRETEPFLFGLVDTESRLGPLVTAKGQAGFAWDRAYIYGTAGWAWAEHEARADIPLLDAHWADNQWLDGFVFGAGAKYAVVDGQATGGPSVIFGIEWNRINLDGDLDNAIRFNGGPVYDARVPMVREPRLRLDAEHDIDVITGNVSIKF